MSAAIEALIEPLVSLAWKSALVAGVALALLWLARGRSPAQRALIAHAALAALVALPVATALLPSWAPLPATVQAAPVPQLPAANAPTTDAPSASAPVTPALPAEPLISGPALLLSLYLIPLALLALAVLVAIGRLFTMRARATVLVETPWLVALARAQRRMGFKNGTALLVSSELRSPISWGLMRPTIVLDPAAATRADEAEAIIAHELAHVARLDWAKLLLARVACALFWFNPLVWLLARESHQLREESADDAVLLAEVDDARYATLLVNAARHDNAPLLLAAHGVAPARNSLKRRITRILDRGLPRGPAGMAWGAMCMAALIAVGAPLAAFSTVAPIAEAPVAAIAAVARPAPPASVAAPRGVVATGIATIATPAPVPAAAQVQDVPPPDRIATRTVDIGDIVAAKAVDLDPDYAAQMARVVRVDDIGDLVGARAVGVDPAYARAMRAVDPTLDLDDLIAARATGLTPGYIGSIKRELPRADISDIVAMRAVGVTPEYVRSMRAAGYDLSDPDDVVSGFASGGWATGRRANPRRTGSADAVPRTPPPPLPPGPPPAP